MSNIAEGFERDGNKEFRQYLYVAKGSAGEFRSLLYVGLDAGYIDQSVFDELTAMALDAIRLLDGFIRYLDRRHGRTDVRRPGGVSKPSSNLSCLQLGTWNLERGTPSSTWNLELGLKCQKPGVAAPGSSV